MSENWPYKLTHVSPGEPVQAGIVSRPDRALAERTDYLKDRLDAAEAGKALFDVDATVSPDVLPGQPVYWNATAHRYEQAIVVVENDDAAQTLVARPSSECVGLCYKKTAADRADIVLRGLVTFENLTAAIGPTVAPGKYYLSAVTPGKLSKQKPPITVAVCYVYGPRDNCSDHLRVLVCPQVRDFLDEHTHYRFELLTTYSGTSLQVTTVDGEERVAIVNNDPDANLPGWLPANHAIFNGKAPAGAKFGYNIKKHPALSRVWPPIPIQSVAVLWDKGLENQLIGATEIPLGPGGVARIDINGIWWMSDCREDVPFLESSPPEPVTGTCPRQNRMRVILVFLRLLFGNNRTVVTSLDKDVNSPIEVTNCDGVVAQTGDLKLDLNLQEIDCSPTEDEELPANTARARSVELLGYDQPGKVYNDVVPLDSTLNPSKNHLKKIWVAEGVIAHNIAQLSVSGSWSRPLTAAEKIYHNFVDGSNQPIAAEVLAHQGLIKINFDDQYADRELAPQIIRLDDAVERIYMDIPYLGFPQGQDSAIRVRLNVPYVNVLSGGNLRLKLLVQVFSRGGNLDTPTSIGQLFTSHRVLTAPISVAQPLPQEDDEGGNILAGVTAKRDHVIQVQTGEVDVTNGDTVLFTLSRPQSDAVVGELGVLRVSGIITKAVSA